MKINNKKVLSVLLVLALVISSVAIAIVAFGDEYVEINEENFPDTTWRNAVSLMYDEDRDGFLSSDERSVSSMIVSGMLELLAEDLGVEEEELEIFDLKGIEYFSSLKSLRCNDIGSFETLDTSALNNLTTLNCSDNGIKYLNISSNDKLTTLHACSNEFESLDLSSNNKLVKVHCYSNLKMKELNVSGLTELEELRCDSCSLTELDLSSNIKLNSLNCSYNNLIKLDLSHNPELVSDEREVTEYNIGYQQTEADVFADNGLIQVALDLEDDKVMSTSLDFDDVTAFYNGAFFTDKFVNMKNGIDYEYNTGLDESIYMTVHINVIERAHQMALLDFDKESNIATIGCIICEEFEEVNFEDAINARIGDQNYNSYLDVVEDGVINAKDYSKLIKMF